MTSPDLEKIANENSRYCLLKDGKLHLRASFEMGSSDIDRRPSDYYSQEFLHNLRNQAPSPMTTLQSMTSFIERNFGSLDAPEATDIQIEYRGKFKSWGALFFGSNDYARLNKQALNLRNFNKGALADCGIVVVKPTSQIHMTRLWQRQFECAPQYDVVSGAMIKPVILCDDPSLALDVDIMKDKGKVICISTRPLNVGDETIARQKVTLRVYKSAQIVAINEKYWPLQAPAIAQDLFSVPSARIS